MSVLIVKSDSISLEQKKTNITSSDYNNIVEIEIADSYNSTKNILSQLKGDVIVITNTSSLFNKETIAKVISPFCENKIGCVSGMSRRTPDTNGNFQDGANWIYENKIKRLESNLGSLSGSNAAIYAFRKELTPKTFTSGVNMDFFIPTSITERGYDVVFQPEALAYEIEVQNGSSLFRKHMLDGYSAKKSMSRFWRLLLPRKGSFVFWSHRVLKWLVPFNLMILLFASAYLSIDSYLFRIFTMIQLIGYFYVITYHLIYTKDNKQMKGTIGKLSDFACYFLTLNLAWFIGLCKLKSN